MRADIALNSITPYRSLYLGSSLEVMESDNSECSVYLDCAASTPVRPAVLDAMMPYLTNNYGNALGANGKWDEALSVYRQASFAGSQAGDNDLSEISDANHALGLLQVGRDADALEEIRGLLRRDPNFLDMRAAETAALWAQGEAEAAEAAWNALQNADTDTGEVSLEANPFAEPLC